MSAIENKLKKAYSHILASERTVKKLLVWKLAERYVMSFPKAGRTWLRVFLAKYCHELYGTPMDIVFMSLKRPHPSMPRVFFSHSGLFGEVLERKKGGDVQVTEDRMKRNLDELAGKDIVLLVRDPRDIVVSYFFYLTRRLGRKDVPQEIIPFMRSREYGIQAIVRYYNAWMMRVGTFGSLTVLKYEDLKSEPDMAFRKFVEALGLPWREGAYRSASAYSDFDNMRKLEEAGAYDEHFGKSDKDAEEETRHVRKGVVGGYLSHFGADELAYMDRMTESLHPHFGYRAP